MGGLEECHAFLEASGGELESFRIIVQNFFVFGDGLSVLLLRVGDLAEIELGVGGEDGVAVILEVVLVFGASEIVLATGDVAEAVGIERVGGGRAAGAAGGGRRGNGRTGVLGGAYG